MPENHVLKRVNELFSKQLAQFARELASILIEQADIGTALCNLQSVEESVVGKYPEMCCSSALCAGDCDNGGCKDNHELGIFDAGTQASFIYSDSEVSAENVFEKTALMAPPVDCAYSSVGCGIGILSGSAGEVVPEEETSETSAGVVAMDSCCDPAASAGQPRWSESASSSEVYSDCESEIHDEDVMSDPGRRFQSAAVPFLNMEYESQYERAISEAVVQPQLQVQSRPPQDPDQEPCVGSEDDLKFNACVVAIGSCCDLVASAGQPRWSDSECSSEVYSDCESEIHDEDVMSDPNGRFQSAAVLLLNMECESQYERVIPEAVVQPRLKVQSQPPQNQDQEPCAGSEYNLESNVGVVAIDSCCDPAASAGQPRWSESECSSEVYSDCESESHDEDVMSDPKGRFQSAAMLLLNMEYESQYERAISEAVVQPRLQVQSQPPQDPDQEPCACSEDDLLPEINVHSPFQLQCRLLSGRLVSVDLSEANCFRGACVCIAEALGGGITVMVLYGGELLDDSVGFARLFEVAGRGEEVTVVTKNRELVWRPDGDFTYNCKPVEEIIRSDCQGSDCVVSYRDGSWVRHPGSPQLDVLFTFRKLWRPR